IWEIRRLLRERLVEAARQRLRASWRQRGASDAELGWTQGVLEPGVLMVGFADDPAVRHRIVFLPDYDMELAHALVQGCDVWLNNPLRPLEACGTSGMKSALNGGLNLSIRDGWWDEWYDGENGWQIPSADSSSSRR